MVVWVRWGGSEVEVPFSWDLSCLDEMVRLVDWDFSGSINEAGKTPLCSCPVLIAGSLDSLLVFKSICWPAVSSFVDRRMRIFAVK